MGDKTAVSYLKERFCFQQHPQRQTKSMEWFVKTSCIFYTDFPIAMCKKNPVLVWSLSHFSRFARLSYFHEKYRNCRKYRCTSTLWDVKLFNWKKEFISPTLSFKITQKQPPFISLLFSFLFLVWYECCRPECSEAIIVIYFPFNWLNARVFMISQHIFYVVIKGIDNYSRKITNYYPFTGHIPTRIHRQLFNCWHWVYMLMLIFLCPHIVFVVMTDRVPEK